MRAEQETNYTCAFVIDPWKSRCAPGLLLDLSLLVVLMG